MKDKISIIIPAYNIADYIERCLASVLAQTYTNMEVIVVDDGSEDNTLQVAESLAGNDSRVKIIRQQNSGVTVARLNGVAEASGEWIGFVDGDDFIEPDMYERLLKNAKKYEADISHCGYQMVFPSRTDFYYNTGELTVQDNVHGINDLITGRKIEPGLWNKLFHRKLFCGAWINDIKKSGIRINEDLLMNYYLFKNSRKAVWEDFCPYRYIVRQKSAANITRQPYHLADPERVGKIIWEDLKSDIKLRSVALRLYCIKIFLIITQKDFPDMALDAEKKLQELIRNGQIKYLPAKDRYMALLMAHCLPLYKLIRFIYNKITRIEHKYDFR